MKALRFAAFGSVSGLSVVDLAEPLCDAEMAIVQVVAAAINPSDVKNVEGKMEGTTLPRVPGRDFSGIVRHGPEDWIGVSVWGTGGEIGYSVDGSHAEYLSVPIASLRRKPQTLTFAEASTVGTTFLAAWLAVMEYARLTPGETLLIIGAGGGVGGSAAQIGRWKGAHVIGIGRQALPDDSPLRPMFDGGFFATEHADVTATLRQATGSRGADVVFDTVGGAMFEPSLSALAHRGRLATIASTGMRRVSFDMLDFYHNESQLFGADTRKRDAVASADLLDAVRPQFENGAFIAPGIDRIIPLADGMKAYADLAAGTVGGRLVLAADPDLAQTR